MITTTIGLLAAFSTTMAFLPQVVKIWRTKSVEDLSFGMFGLFTLGIILWLTYGILINDLPVIVANSVTLLLQAAILTQILRYRRPLIYSAQLRMISKGGGNPSIEPEEHNLGGFEP